MRARIVCLPGDGIGPEVMQEAVRVLTSVACAFDHSFTFVEEKLGRSALQAHGTPLGDKALDACRAADAVLLGACGSLRQDTSFGGTRPESGLRLLQQGLSLHTGIMHCANPSAPQTGGVDISLVWPLAGGTGAASADEDGQHASDTVSLTPLGAEQAARLAFRLARQRHRHVCAAFLADLDATARLFRDSSLHVSRDYQDVTVKWLEADRLSLELIKNPSKFDVLLAGPLLNSPLSGIAAGLAGGFGLVPCVLAGDGNPLVYLPSQGEEPSQAGRDTANPIAMILCAALMLRKSLHLDSEADCVEMAVKNVLDSGWRTADMVSGTEPKVGTQAIGKLIAEQVDTAGAVMGAFRR